MPHIEQLPFLIKLIDDDSDFVVTSVFQELEKFGPSLKIELKHLVPPLNPLQRQIIKPLLIEQNRVWLKSVWSSWFGLADDLQKLETALGLLAKFQDEFDEEKELEVLLNNLSQEYRCRYAENDPYQLGDFLFKVKKLKGAVTDYYRPQNSNLVQVIQQGQGLPISLCCVYMLVGERLGLNIQGCNFPGHFLARFEIADTMVWVDCFNGGRLLTQDELMRRSRAKGTEESIQEIIRAYTSSEVIVVRVLNNLIKAFHQEENEENVLCLQELFKMMGGAADSRQKNQMVGEK